MLSADQAAGWLNMVAKSLVPKPWRNTVRRHGRVAIYQGRNVTCPCCGLSFSKFMPFGVRQVRLNAQCPNCNVLERHRTLWLYLQERTNLFWEPLKILHVAPEQFFQSRLRALPNLDYLSVDLASPHAMVRMDITALAFADDTFDVILCNHVMEHIPDDRRAMSELYRVLKPGGLAILQVPIDASRTETLEDPAINTPALRREYYGQEDHVRQYGLDYPERLAACGFTVEPDRYLESLDPDAVRRYGLSCEVIYRCGK